MTKEHDYTKKRKIRKTRILIPVLIVIIFFIYFVLQSNEISVTVIKNQECDFCTNVQPIVDMINESEDVKINYFNELDYKESEAQALINKLDIITVPMIIVQGNAFTKTAFFNELSSDQIKKQADKFLIGNIKPPLTLVANGVILGNVNVIYLQDKECKECADMNHVINKFKGLGVSIKEIKQIDISSSEGQDLIQRNNIKKVPTLIFDKELQFYLDIKNNWQLYGTIEDNGLMIMRKILPPYKDLESGETKGLIKLTYLVDKTCTQCYDPSIHKQVISRIMPYYSDEVIVDVNDKIGQDFVDKYNIKTIPTIILSKDVNEYPLFESLFGNVFEKQDDETFVFKNNKDLKGISYKDLETGEIFVNSK